MVDGDLEDTETGLPQNAFATPTRQDSNRAAAQKRAKGGVGGHNTQQIVSNNWGAQRAVRRNFLNKNRKEEATNKTNNVVVK